VLEVALNAFATEWVFRPGQNDRADDLIASNLRSQKYFPFRKVRVGKFHELTASIHLCPFVFHLFEPALVSHAAWDHLRAVLPELVKDLD
jgi:hypothetical protein